MDDGRGEVTETNVDTMSTRTKCEVSSKRKRIMMKSEPNIGEQVRTRIAPEVNTASWESMKKDMKRMMDEGLKDVMPKSKLRSEHETKQPEDGAALTHTVRFDGKNYHAWANQMEILLKDFNLAHVLYEQCPSAMLGPEASSTQEFSEPKAAEEKWAKDDSLCVCVILSNLSDNLSHRYLKQNKAPTTAKQLWQELKSEFGFSKIISEFGTKSRLVKKYIEFQILEAKPIVEQVEEFNSICISVCESGMAVDATFHACVIMSKLPASWEDVRVKLMREEYLPLRALMFRLRSEELERKVRMAKEALVTDGEEASWEIMKKFNPVKEETGAKIMSDFAVELKLSNQMKDGLLSLHYDFVHEGAPIDTVRFFGENYPVWAHRMELMLKELNVAYVLYEPSPNIARGPEASSGVSAGSEKGTCEEKWAKDDSLCLRMILFHLYDDLFDRYSKGMKTMSARQLWEELKVRFGIDRRLVGKYIEFQMIEGSPVVKQVWEFHGICKSLVESRVFISEKFHVRAVISKLPASWKDVSIKLMQEENLPLAILMDRLIVEEESRGSKGKSPNLFPNSEVVAA